MSTVDAELLLFCLVPAVLFTVVYGLLVPWYRSVEGTHLLGFTLCVSLLLGRSLLLRLDIDPPGGLWALRVLIFVVGLFLWQRCWLLVRAQWAGAHYESPPLGPSGERINTEKEKH